MSAQPRVLEHGAELGQGEVDPEAGDRLELVEGAAGVAQAAAGDHRHVDAAGRGQRREHEAGLVADAARRVLVDLGAGELGEVEHLAGAHHRLGEGQRSPPAVMPRKKTAMARAEAW